MRNILLFVFCSLVHINLLRLAEASCQYGLLENTVNSSEITTIVDAHNKHRLLIAQGKVPGQPRGVNLKRMKWDSQLASEAQKIANTCVYAHSKVTDKRWYSVGQNLFTQYSSHLMNQHEWATGIKLWFDEYKSFQYPNKKLGNGPVGHYTQVVWADSSHVGCGFASYRINNPPFNYQRLYVCNYGPGGNFIGQAPYRTGGKGCENLC